LGRHDEGVNRPSWLLPWLALASGCAGGSAYDKAWVSAELERTAGHGIQPRDVPSLPKSVGDVSALTEDDAVSVALWNSAQFRADLAQLDVSRADLADASALPNPNLSFLFPVSTRQFELSAQYPISQLVQRPWRVAAAKYDVERTARALVQSGLDAVRDVRIAWAELAGAEQRRLLRERAEELVRKSADLAMSRFTNGDISKLEADLVRGEALAAAELAKRGVREETVARIRLRQILGLATSPLGTNVGVRPFDVLLDRPREQDELERAALASRPDLRAAELAIEAAGERVGLERARIVQLFARLDAKPVGTRGGSPVVWPPGVGGEIPIFNQNAGGRGRAGAELDRASWSYLALRQQVVSDVRAAREELVMALGSREPWSETIVPLQENNVAAAMRAYESGGESYLVVLEATRRLVDARMRELELGLDVARARARLDRAVGWRIRAKS
jgi:cobalt-zinc-cadmium efflux system outer membrane protein